MTVNLVLGGDGFIGRHVGLALAQQEHRVRLAGRAARELNWTPQLTFYEDLQQTLTDHANGARLVSSLLSGAAA